MATRRELVPVLMLAVLFCVPDLGRAGIVNENEKIGANDAGMSTSEKRAVIQQSVETSEQDEAAGEEQNDDPTYILAILGLLALGARSSLGRMYGIFGQFSAVAVGGLCLITGVDAAFSTGGIGYAIYGVVTTLTSQSQS